jgi:electron transport complex protein RnfB
MHTVLPSLCSGCDLCVAPCPMDCIAMVAADRAWTQADADAARRRHQARSARLQREQHADDARLAAARKQAEVQAAIARARARRAGAQSSR